MDEPQRLDQCLFRRRGARRRDVELGRCPTSFSLGSRQALVEIEVTRADRFAMKYKFSRALLAALIASITFFYPLLAPVPHRIDEAHFKLIEKGMPYSQILAIFGVRPGDYDWAEADRQIAPSLFHISQMKPDFFRTRSWASRNGAFYVFFDESDRVLWKWHCPAVRIVSPWQRAWTWWTSK